MKKDGLTPADIQRAEDLAKLPILTKDIFRAHAKELLSRTAKKMKPTWTKTGGTTGEPIRVAKNRECKAWDSMCLQRGYSWGGLGVNEPRVAILGGSLGIDRMSLSNRIGTLLRHDLFIPAFELRRDTVGPYFDKIRTAGYRFLVGYASAIYRLALLAKEQNETIQFAAVFPTAELILPEWEKVIGETFNCAVLPFYGCGEINSLGYSCLGTDGYLIPEEHAILEIRQSDGSTGLWGDGQFLVTDLDNYAMPVIRYANGDAGKIAPSRGHLPFSRIERLDGRYNSLLMTDSGDLISGVIGTHVFRHTTSVKSYRIIQEEPLRIVIKIVPKDDFCESDRLVITKLFTQHLGSRMKITIEKVPDLPRPPSGKSVFVVNRCLEKIPNT